MSASTGNQDTRVYRKSLGKLCSVAWSWTSMYTVRGEEAQPEAWYPVDPPSLHLNSISQHPYVSFFFSVPVFWQVHVKSHRTDCCTSRASWKLGKRGLVLSKHCVSLSTLGHFAPGCRYRLWFFNLCFAEWEGS